MEQKLGTKEQAVLGILLKRESLSSSDVHFELSRMGISLSLVTVKRDLTELRKLGFTTKIGAGRSVKYSISPLGRMFTSVDAKEYLSLEPDKRYGLTAFNFNLFPAIPDKLFSDTELKRLGTATGVYRDNVTSMSNTLKEKELERFIIELSWKSSKIEGNTYTLLDTEKLISKGIKAPGHDRGEAEMIVNHKEAFKFIREQSESFNELNLVKIDHVHKILVKGLGVSHGVRARAVGVTGSPYRPLDTSYQITEAVESLCKVVNSIESPYAKAMIALLGISYIQPFEDGNKRTSRLIANAILLAHNCAPLSYRSVDEDEYREAVLAFYELNSLLPFKKIFIDQYTFAALNYAVSVQ
jgi:Fic family protein